MKWKTEQRRIAELVPLEVNPRQLTEKQRVDLEKSLLKFDLAEIPAINKDNTIIAGHMRIRILSAMGRENETIDVRVPDRKLKRKEVEEYCIRSNLNTGEWDMDALTNNFEHEDLIDWGFEQDKLLGSGVQDEIGNDEPGGGKEAEPVTCPKCQHTFYPEDK